MSNAFTVWQKSHPSSVTEQDIVDGSIRGAKMAAEVNRLNDKKKEDGQWRQELDELNRRLAGMPSVEEAQAKADALKAAVAALHEEYEVQLAACREQLKMKFLSPLERTHISQRISQITGQLAESRRTSDAQVRFAEGRLKDAKTWAPKRERWLELRKRARDIEKALEQIQ